MKQSIMLKNNTNTNNWHSSKDTQVCTWKTMQFNKIDIFSAEERVLNSIIMLQIAPPSKGLRTVANQQSTK